MKILVIGGTGTIGQAVVAELAQRHEVITAGMNHGDLSVDIGELASIKALYTQISSLDAVVMTVGKVHFAPLAEMNEASYSIGLSNKLMGQVNTVLEGIPHLNEGGSFTLTSGILNQDPIVQGSSAAMVNGGLEGFVKSAAIELPRGLRINVVSPTVITEALPSYGPYFRGYVSVDVAKAALAYAKSVEGKQTGQLFTVFG